MLFLNRSHNVHFSCGPTLTVTLRLRRLEGMWFVFEHVLNMSEDTRIEDVSLEVRRRCTLINGMVWLEGTSDDDRKVGK